MTEGSNMRTALVLLDSRRFLRDKDSASRSRFAPACSCSLQNEEENKECQDQIQSDVSFKYMFYMSSLQCTELEAPNSSLWAAWRTG